MLKFFQIIERFCHSPGDFGLSSAPYLFTKILKPVIKFWRSQGISILMYIDYGIGSSSSYTSAKITSLHVHADLLKFGFLPNEQKCHRDPLQFASYLGTSINTADSSISATDKRIDSILCDLDALLSNTSFVHVKSVASGMRRNNFTWELCW
jgi:hypothetical protein